MSRRSNGKEAQLPEPPVLPSLNALSLNREAESVGVTRNAPLEYYVFKEGLYNDRTRLHVLDAANDQLDSVLNEMTQDLCTQYNKIYFKDLGEQFEKTVYNFEQKIKRPSAPSPPTEYPDFDLSWWQLPQQETKTFFGSAFVSTTAIDIPLLGEMKIYAEINTTVARTASDDMTIDIGIMHMLRKEKTVHTVQNPQLAFGLEVVGEIKESEYPARQLTDNQAYKKDGSGSLMLRYKSNIKWTDEPPSPRSLGQVPSRPTFYLPSEFVRPGLYQVWLKTKLKASDVNEKLDTRSIKNWLSGQIRNVMNEQLGDFGTGKPNRLGESSKRPRTKFNQYGPRLARNDDGEEEQPVWGPRLPRDDDEEEEQPVYRSLIADKDSDSEDSD